MNWRTPGRPLWKPRPSAPPRPGPTSVRGPPRRSAAPPLAALVSGQPASRRCPWQPLGLPCGSATPNPVSCLPRPSSGPPSWPIIEPVEPALPDPPLPGEPVLRHRERAASEDAPSAPGPPFRCARGPPPRAFQVLEEGRSAMSCAGPLSSLKPSRGPSTQPLDHGAPGRVAIRGRKKRRSDAYPYG